MIDLPNRPSLLEELDARQDQVLEQLEQLNARVEALIGQFTASRTADDQSGLLSEHGVRNEY